MTLIIVVIILAVLFGGYGYSGAGVGVRPYAPYGVGTLLLLAVILYFVGAR